MESGLRTNQERDLKPSHETQKPAVTLVMCTRAADSSISPSPLCVAAEAGKVEEDRKKYNLPGSFPTINNRQDQTAVPEL